MRVALILSVIWFAFSMSFLSANMEIFFIILLWTLVLPWTLYFIIIKTRK